MIVGHGGNIYDLARRLGCEISEIIDMSSNVNPLGPPSGVEDALMRNLECITRLPEVDSKSLIQDFANRCGINPDRVLAGNGSTQFIYAIPQALKPARAIIVGPTYSDYADSCSMQDIPYEYFFLRDTDAFRLDFERMQSRIGTGDIVFVCNPNNPTGVLYPASQIEILCNARPDASFIVDESYLPFVGSETCESMVGVELPNLIVLNSMSKIFRISGLRIGFVIASPDVIQRLSRYMLPWSVNSLAQVAVKYLLENPSEVDAFIEHTQKFLEVERNRMIARFDASPQITFFSSTTSFLLARLNDAYTADTVCDRLAMEKILIRNCSNFKGLSNRYIRVSLKRSEMNRSFSERLAVLLHGERTLS
jgi:threonine-phosphate decarboxylase